MGSLFIVMAYILFNLGCWGWLLLLLGALLLTWLIATARFNASMRRLNAKAAAVSARQEAAIDELRRARARLVRPAPPVFVDPSLE